MGPAEGWPDLLRNVALNLRALNSTARMPNLRGRGIFLDFFTRTLDFAFSPHLSCQPLAAAVGINGKRKGWPRFQGQVRGRVRNPDWFHRDLVDQIGAIFAQVFRCNRNCRLPLFLAPAMAYDFREMRGLVPGRRCRVNGCRMGSAHSGRRASRGAVSRNLGRARRRWLGELAAAKTVWGGADSHRGRGHYGWALGR